MDALFPYIVLIVMGGFLFAIISFIWRTAFNLAQPLQTRRARVVSRREHSSGGHGVGDHHDPHHTWSYLTFEFEDGSRQEFPVTGGEYATVMEGETGLLHSQGYWFRRFERDWSTALHG